MPIPIITPVSSGLPRDHDHRAPASAATAIRSQLISPASTRAGDAANSIASQGRRRCTPARNQAASSANGASSTAVTLK